MRALRALKRSPLALDLYAWLTFQAFRAHQSERPRFETWQQLHNHMGGDYADIDNFRKKVKSDAQGVRARPRPQGAQARAAQSASVAAH